jgi:threonine dehydratase
MIAMADIYEAKNLIYYIVRKTPLYKAQSLSEKYNSDLYYKLEFLQDTRSFKVRGATNYALHLSDEKLESGLTTYSTGNHGRATAHVAKKLNTDAKICISENVPQNKIDGIKSSGGKPVIYGKSQDEAQEKALELNRNENRSVVPPFDHKHIICGQGTIGLELLEKLPKLDSVLVPLSGGGLISGIAYVVKSINPDCKVYGISMEDGAAMYESLKADKPVQVKEADSLADSLQGGILLDNKYTFEMVKKYVDEVVLVSEEEIKNAIAHAFYEEHFILEGAAAVGIAAILSDKVDVSNQKSAVILTGTNISNEEFISIIKNN